MLRSALGGLPGRCLSPWPAHPAAAWAAAAAAQRHQSPPSCPQAAQRLHTKTQHWPWIQLGLVIVCSHLKDNTASLGEFCAVYLQVPACTTSLIHLLWLPFRCMAQIPVYCMSCSQNYCLAGYHSHKTECIGGHLTEASTCLVLSSSCQHPVQCAAAA